MMESNDSPYHCPSIVQSRQAYCRTGFGSDRNIIVSFKLMKKQKLSDDGNPTNGKATPMQGIRCLISIQLSNDSNHGYG